MLPIPGKRWGILRILMWLTILKICWIHLKPKVCRATKRAVLSSRTKVNYNSGSGFWTWSKLQWYWWWTFTETGASRLLDWNLCIFCQTVVPKARLISFVTKQPSWLHNGPSIGWSYWLNCSWRKYHLTCLRAFISWDLPIKWGGMVVQRVRRLGLRSLGHKFKSSLRWR